MSQSNTLFIGLDVHKVTTDVAFISDSLTHPYPIMELGRPYAGLHAGG